MYKKIIRPLLFCFTPEKIHYIVFCGLKIASVCPGRKIISSFFSDKDSIHEKEVFGIKFPNPIGLAAGFDKDAEVYEMFGAMGFGFVEIGTITPVGQPGNPKPRLFRLKKNSALINRMGFNNDGVENAIKNLRKKKSNLIIGGNIGKNKITHNEKATDDYIICFEKLFPFVDYFVVNVSSPNTPNLRELQDKKPLTELLTSLQNLNLQKEKQKPILLKIAPDLTNEQLDDIIDIVSLSNISGIVATNTTISRENLDYSKTEIENFGNGGLSGKPVKNRSTEVIRYLHKKSEGKIPIIGVGGIFSVEDAKEKLEAGASLVQLYTGFVYEGPWVVKRILKNLK